MMPDVSDFTESTSSTTIVSLLPFEIEETKPGLIPGSFKIPAAPVGGISVLVIGDSYHSVYIGDGRPSIPVTDPSYKVGRSIVNDFIIAQLGRVPDSEPGLFCVPGEYTAEEVLEHFPELERAARANQTRWFEKLVAIADDEWTRNRQRRAISDLSKHGAKFLGLDREWLYAAKIDEPIATPVLATKPCAFCTENIPVEAAVCKYCRNVVDQKRFDELMTKAS